MYFGYYCYGLLLRVNIHAVYVLGIGGKILLLLMYMYLALCTCVTYVVAWFNLRTDTCSGRKFNLYID
jgi:hypothetical protein